MDQPCSHYQSSDILNSLKEANSASGGFRSECSREITSKEILSRINEWPGNDGLTSEFDQVFVNGVVKFLVPVYDDAFYKEELPQS